VYDLVSGGGFLVLAVAVKSKQFRLLPRGGGGPYDHVKRTGRLCFPLTFSFPLLVLT
jgi:hypothetical protein